METTVVHQYKSAYHALLANYDPVSASIIKSYVRLFGGYRSGSIDLMRSYINGDLTVYSEENSPKIVIKSTPSVPYDYVKHLEVVNYELEIEKFNLTRDRDGWRFNAKLALTALFAVGAYYFFY